MIIVIEGVDATGKSTLAESFKKEWGVEVRHSGPPERHPLIEYGQLFDSPTTPSVIFDRYHWGEEVYGPLYRGKSGLGTFGFLWMEFVLLARGAVTILAQGDVPHIVDRAQGDEFLKEVSGTHIHDLQQRFSGLRRRALTPVLLHNIDDGPLIDPALLGDVAHQRSRLIDPAALNAGYIGDPRPEVVFVQGETGANFSHLPFAPFPGSDSDLFFRAIDTREYLYLGVGFLAADATANLDHVWNVLGRPRVVALGYDASHSLQAAGVPHSRAHAPGILQNLGPESYKKYGDLLWIAANEPGSDWRVKL